MRYYNEEQFGQLFINSPYLNNLFDGDRFYYADQLTTSLGVPDYVFLSEQDLSLLNTFATTYSGLKLTSKYAAVISYVARNDCPTICDISTFMREREGQTLRTLGELENNGVVNFDRSDKEVVTLNPHFNVPLLNSVAVELKLSSWEKALWQAIRNSSQFISSCVVMPSDKYNIISNNINLFENNSIGTAVLNVEDLSLTKINTHKNLSVINSRYYLQAIDTLMTNIWRFKPIDY